MIDANEAEFIMGSIVKAEVALWTRAITNPPEIELNAGAIFFTEAGGHYLLISLTHTTNLRWREDWAIVALDNPKPKRLTAMQIMHEKLTARERACIEQHIDDMTRERVHELNQLTNKEKGFGEAGQIRPPTIYRSGYIECDERPTGPDPDLPPLIDSLTQKHKPPPAGSPTAPPKEPIRMFALSRPKPLRPYKLYAPTVEVIVLGDKGEEA